MRNVRVQCMLKQTLFCVLLWHEENIVVFLSMTSRHFDYDLTYCEVSVVCPGLPKKSKKKHANMSFEVGDRNSDGSFSCQ